VHSQAQVAPVVPLRIPPVFARLSEK
jgi:hypothetical protein